MNRNSYIQILLKYLLPIYILAVVILTIFRGIFVYTFYEDFLLLYKSTGELYPVLLKAFAKGFRYDNIVVAYIMALPLLGLIISWIADAPSKLFVRISRIYIIIAFAFVFALSCMDLPYFKYFWTHPTVTILDWIGFGGTFGMLVQESSYYIYYLLFFLSLGLIVSATIFCAKWADKDSNRNLLLSNPLIQIIFLLIATILCFIGTRGQISISPLGINAAYFTDNKLVSNLCVTPAYHFMHFIDDYEIDFDELMDADEAIANVQQMLNIKSDSTQYQNPISRYILADSTKASSKYNVVLVFMESLSVDLMHQEFNGQKLTPFIDSLAQSSYYFENFYSSGVHTNVGVASTLISYPSRFSTHMMNRQPFAYKGIATTLKSKGYSTSFFMPNEEVYDNMGLFLRNNGIDTIFSDNHYPKEAMANNFGVPDDYLFNFAIEEINKSSKSPFFANILTVSNHPPYVVPNEYKNKADRDDMSILAYVDNSLKDFMQKASEQDWYKNTIFIFHGDHGKLVGNQTYSMPLSYNHIPLIVYSPAFEDMPKKLSQFGGQIDIFPTIMGLLNESYINSTMGVDLLKVERPYMFFASDTQLGCIDDKYFYIFNPKEKSEYLYDREAGNIDNIISSQKEIATQMRKYALSMLTATNYLEQEALVEKE